ncbi:MAG: anti-sigma factor family protein [Myxococcaceae bacterium]
MFNCRDSIHLLLEFLDGDMPEEEARHLQEHLRQCPPCVDFLKTYRATPGLCRRALQNSMPAQLSEKLTEFLRTKMKKA